ncbi:putative GCN5-related N-acetyltransferase [uncultured spirochete]|uniref:Putative GCN5-related N-acetyltransferase n=1 Tax=uncultured spirochete TaxID=156406 RepID=A0A3P3XS83_9SPIR|nr:putative GCN5-related N-acetyltransferase [uncultured spirochete]
MFSSFNFKEYESVMSNNGAFKGVEVVLMIEILKDWQQAPGQPYTLLELRDGKTLVAFAIIHQVSGRNFTFDIRFIVLDRDYRSSTAIQHLFEMIDEELLKKIPFAVIRIEISSVKKESLGENALENASYCQIGHIAAYYGENDDFFFYIKAIFRNPPDFIKISKPFEDALSSAAPLEEIHTQEENG